MADVGASPLLELRGVTKTFGALKANDGVSLAVGAGRIHALLGENGAGKSTLVKIVFGVLKPDSGDMLWQGAPVEVASPAAARKLGIGMVFQHFSLFDAMTVAENVALGLDGARADAALERRIVEVAESYGLPLDPRRATHTLSVGERQRIEIVRALLQDPKLLVMDEPTSVLTPQEVERLFVTLRKLRDEGRSILYISHKLREIEELCDAATILRQGRVVAEVDPRRTDARRMAELMIGSELKGVARPAARAPGEVRLAVRGLDLPPEGQFETPLRGASFEVRAGEVLGIAGVAGNGQVELMRALTGERRAPRADMILLDGAPVGALGPEARRKLGLAGAPEERNGHAAVGDMSLADNAFLSARHVRGLTSRGALRPRAARAYARDVIAAFAVKAGGPDALARSLSGGNLQKYVVGREMLQAPKVFVVAQPTWGVDAGATAAIRQAIVDLAAGGAAVVVVSQDLDELREISDRLVALNAGRVSRAVDAASASVEEIGLMMGGVHGEPPAATGGAVGLAH
ncbi:MAG: ABC transporter ATP-binding protein [Hyphomicrobiales bacterium]|nr:ABC transporter ATP-binding protein [Hyphomicrobiales bacterium]